MSIERQAAEVRSVKRYEQGFISNPACISAKMTCGELIKLQEKCGFSGFPVTESGQMKSKLLGLVTKRDSDFFPSESTLIEDAWQNNIVEPFIAFWNTVIGMHANLLICSKDIMTKAADLITAKEGIALR